MSACDDKCARLVYVQERDQCRAAGMLLDLVITELEEDERTAYNQLIYALVKTEQQEYASMLDGKLTKQYLRDKALEHG